MYTITWYRTIFPGNQAYIILYGETRQVISVSVRRYTDLEMFFTEVHQWHFLFQRMHNTLQNTMHSKREKHSYSLKMFVSTNTKEMRHWTKHSAPQISYRKINHLLVPEDMKVSTAYTSKRGGQSIAPALINLTLNVLVQEPNEPNNACSFMLRKIGSFPNGHSTE